MDTRTLEQVIMDASRGFYEPRARSHMVTAEAEVIADAVRAWMRERECIMPGSLCKKTHDNARIKELEAEVERLKAMTYLPSNEAIDKAAKYDALCGRFPYLPGDEFWTYLQGAIRKWSVCEVWIGGEEILCKGVANGKQSPVYRMHECHPTADACRAAIPVEEGEKIETKSNA